MTTIWISKYALTQGVYPVEASEIHKSETMAVVPPVGDLGLTQYFHGKHWHLTQANANAEAQRMRTRKVASLKKQLERLQALRFN